MSAWQGQQYNPQYQQPRQPLTQGRNSWQDPRFTNQNSYQANFPVSQTPVSPVQAYNVPNAPDTSNWGVKLNQSQQSGYPAASKPPLPPRPSSSLAHNSSPAPPTHIPSWQAPAWQTPIQQTPVGYTQDIRNGAGYSWAPGPFPNQQTSAPPQHQPSPQSPAPQPPSPPPRPSAYQLQAQHDQSQWAQRQYSHYTGSHHYDPDIRAQNYSHQQPSQEAYHNPVQQPMITQAQATQVDQRPPVSPEETHAVPWTSASQTQTSSRHSRIESGTSALGAGGPSDWEHFQGSVGAEGDEDRANNVSAVLQSKTPPLNDHYAELPANFPRTASKRVSPQQGPLQHPEPAAPAGTTGRVPIREHSVSPEPRNDGLRRTATIDGLIQEWSTPLNRSNAPGESRKSSISTLDHSRRDADVSTKSSPRQPFQTPKKAHDKGRTSEHESLGRNDPAQPASPIRFSTLPSSLAPAPISTRTIEVDPYPDLGPEYKASLARYVTMLRKEEAASEEEKYKVFKAFVLKENRLRSILYGIDSDESELSTSPQIRTAKVERELLAAGATQTQGASASPIQPAQMVAVKVPDSSREMSPKLTIETTPASNEDSYVVVERDGESEYSPGGRPRMPRNTPRRTASHPPARSAPRSTYSPSDYAPIVIDEIPQPPRDQAPSLPRDPLQRPGTAPLALRNGVTDDAFKFEPPRPAYTPFRYAEGPPRPKTSIGARPAYQAYSALRHQSEESGRVMTQSTAHVATPARRETLTSPTGNSARREHEEAFLGLIREKSRAYRVGKQRKAPSALASDQMPLPEIVDGETQAINALRKLIPSKMPQQRRASPQIVEAKNTMSEYPDVFTWIPETVIKWDRENKALRMKQEQERQKRQEESENNIDALFNDHEIGYSDIGQLEADFKLAEATKKYDEDVEELESFTENVFKPVTERLKEDLFQLNAQYIRTIDMLELEADSGNQYVFGDGDRASRSEAMELVLAFYNKLQIRHVKTAEAHYERERRRKKLELSVLHTNGDNAAMTKLETEFTRAEREQSLHEAREKDSRANKLMDIFDRATVRGLGDNQQFIDDVVAKLQTIHELLKEKQENAAQLLSTGLRELLRLTEELLDYVANDSKSLLSISNTADNMLNSADYDVSVAEAKVANAAVESMKILAEEKRKEDERISAEVETRMGSVAKGPDNALSLVRNIMKRLGDDPQHHDRVQKALEAAKLRNASKTPVG